MSAKSWFTGLLAVCLALPATGANAMSRYQYRVPLHAMAAAPGLAFGESGLVLTAAAGQTVTKSVELRNTGNVSLSGVSLKLEPSTVPVLLLDGCSSITLAVGAGCVSSIQFTAGEVGASAAKLLAAATGGATASATIALSSVPDVSSAKVTSVVATPSSLVADGVSEALARATVYDAYGNVVAGIPITWATSLGSLTAATSTTDANGIAATRLTSGTLAGIATLTAKAPSTNAVGTSVPLVGNAVTAATSALTASPASLTANGVSSSTLSTTVRDANGNSLGAGIPVYWTTTAGTLAAAMTATDASGVARVTLTSSTSAGTATVSAKASTGAAASTPVAFIADSSTAAVASVTSSQASLAATGSTTALLSAIVKDGKGNLVGPGLSVSWTTNLGSLSSGTSMTDGNGTATMTLTTGTALGTATINAVTSQNATQRSVNVAFIPDTASAQVTGISVANASVTAGQSTNVVATVQDAYGHVLEGFQVNFSTTLGSVNTPVSSVAGKATAVATSASAGQATIRAYTPQQGAGGGRTATVNYMSACQTFSDFTPSSGSYAETTDPYGTQRWNGGWIYLNGNPIVYAIGTSVSYGGYTYTIGSFLGYFMASDEGLSGYAYTRCPQ